MSFTPLVRLCWVWDQNLRAGGHPVPQPHRMNTGLCAAQKKIKEKSYRKGIPGRIKGQPAPPVLLVCVKFSLGSVIRISHIKGLGKQIIWDDSESRQRKLDSSIGSNLSFTHPSLARGAGDSHGCRTWLSQALLVAAAVWGREGCGIWTCSQLKLGEICLERKCQFIETEIFH